MFLQKTLTQPFPCCLCSWTQLLNKNFNGVTCLRNDDFLCWRSGEGFIFDVRFRFASGASQSNIFDLNDVVSDS